MTTPYLLYRPLLDQDGKPVVRNPTPGEHWLDTAGNLEFDSFDEPRQIYVRVTEACVMEPHVHDQRRTHMVMEDGCMLPMKVWESQKADWPMPLTSCRLVPLTPPPPAVPEWEREFEERFGIYAEATQNAFKTFIRELLEKEKPDQSVMVLDTGEGEKLYIRSGSVDKELLESLGHTSPPSDGDRREKAIEAARKVARGDTCNTVDEWVKNIVTAYGGGRNGQ